MSTVLGLIGIIIAIVLFIVLVYKGWRNYYVAPVCMLVVCLFNWVNPVTALTTQFIPGLVDLFTTTFIIIFLGVIFGKTYVDTGASISIANFLVGKFVDPKEGNKKIFGAVISFFIISSLCVAGGIDCYALFFTLFPIAVVIAQKAGIPRRFLPGMLYLNCAFFCCPGVPQIYNIMTEVAFATVGMEYDIWGAAVPGFIAVAVIAVGSIAVLYTMIKKAVAKGEVFEYGAIEHYAIQEGRKLPNPILALIPLVLVFVLYSIVGLDISVALTCGIVSDLVLMGRFIDRSAHNGSIKETFKSMFNTSVDTFPNALLGVCMPIGLAMVITGTATFGVVVAFISGLNIHPVILIMIVVCVVVAATSCPPAAIMVAVPLVVGILAAKGVDMNPNAMGRVAALAAATFETLPINGAIILTMQLSKCTHKEAYKPQFMESIVFCLVGTVVCALLLVAFPGLA